MAKTMREEFKHKADIALTLESRGINIHLLLETINEIIEIIAVFGSENQRGLNFAWPIQNLSQLESLHALKTFLAVIVEHSSNDLRRSSNPKDLEMEKQNNLEKFLEVMSVQLNCQF